MFKLKPIYEYLGETEALLDSRSTSRCAGEVPTVVVVEETEVVSTPAPLTGFGEPTRIDCDVANSDVFMVVALMGGTSPLFASAIAGVVLRRNADGSVTEIGAYQQIAAAGGKGWANPHVAMMTPTKFVLSAQSTADDKLYVIVGTINHTTGVIVSQLPAEVGATNTSSIEGEVLRIDANRALFFYPGDAGNPQGQGVVGTLSGVSIAFGTSIDVSTYTIQQLHDLAYTDYADEFYLLARGDGGGYRNIKISVDSGSTLTEDGESGDLTHYTGTTVTALRRISPDIFASASINATNGGEIVVNEYTTGTVKVTGKITVDTTTHAAGDLVGFEDNRFTYFYSTLEGSGRVGYERFTYDGVSTVTSGGDFLIETKDCSVVRASKVGFTTTKYPVVYIDQSAASDPIGKVFIYEAGATW